MSVTVFCDFDGTISTTDTAHAVFTAFAAPAWRDVEVLWEAGEIGSATCMRRQMELVDASLPELDALLDEVDIDPSFPEFAEFCATNAIGLIVLSDGVDYFIRRILSRFRLGHLLVRANRYVQRGARQHSLTHPYSLKDCASGAGTCKCACAYEKAPARSILIGDGRSDFCLAHEADLVFAKKKLLSYTRSQGIPSTAFSSFAEITAAMESAVIPSFAAANPQIASVSE
jgi:2,3-diketo-5-methylthio-1-phosphopentane phosphatase